MMVRHCDRGSFWRRVFYVLLQSLLPLLNLFFLRMLIDAVSSAFVPQGTPSAFLPWLLAMVGVFLLNRIVAALDRVNNDVLTQRLTDYMSDIIQRQATRLDMAYYDTPSYHDTFHRAQQEAGSRPQAVLNNFMAVGGAALSVFVVILMLLSAAWWVVLVMVLAVLPSFAVRLHKARSIYNFRRQNTQLYRRTAYFGRLLTSREVAKEIRAFRLAPHFRRLFVESRAQLVQRLLHISRRLGMADILCGIIEAIAMLLIVWLLATKAFAGAITIGTFVMLFEAFRRGQGYLTTLVAGLAGLYDNRLFVANLFEFLNLQPSIHSPSAPIPMPEQIECIELRQVNFRYPNMDHDVLHEYNFTARVGEVTRLEGRNGYGKTTLLKLLLRLYDPQQGAVYLNGVDIRQYDVVELRKRMGVLFQDFVTYCCTAEDNIVFGNVDHFDTDITTASRLAGADGVIERLPHHQQTMLGRLFDGGTELSMGQWQRIALARALQSAAPVLLLDEPMAWLDNAAREHLMQSIDEIKHNKIIILVTHT